MFRKATAADLDAIERIYNKIHDAEDRGELTTGWVSHVYPVRATAEAALGRGDLFVLEEDGEILGAGVINQLQVDVYADAPWEFAAKDEEVCVFHTLTIDPDRRGTGLGTRFMQFYEDCAREMGCTELRIDTNARNLSARSLYRKLGYREIGIVPTVFNGIRGVNLVLLEKHL